MTCTSALYKRQTGVGIAEKFCEDNGSGTYIMGREMVLWLIIRLEKTQKWAISLALCRLWSENLIFEIFKFQTPYNRAFQGNSYEIMISLHENVHWKLNIGGWCVVFLLWIKKWGGKVRLNKKDIDFVINVYKQKNIVTRDDCLNLDQDFVQGKCVRNWTEEDMKKLQ